MKCNNPITIAHYKYKNGEKHSVIEGSQSVMIPRIKQYGLDKSINGYYEHINCDGNVLISIFARNEPQFYESEIQIIFQCDKCGITHELPYTLEDIENMINKLV